MVTMLRSRLLAPGSVFSEPWMIRTRRPWVLQCGALLFYVVATWFMLFPQPLHWNDHVRDLGDPLADTWVMAWDAYTLLDNPANLFEPNIFYPYPNALAFSESEIASGLLALPVFQFTGNATFAYNFVYFFSFVVCGFSAYLLAYDLTRHRAGALLGGFAFAFWSYRMQHASHLNLLTLQYMPLVFFALRRAWLSGRWTFAVMFGVTLVFQVLSSWYAALILVMGIGLLGVYLLIAKRREFAWHKVLPLVVVCAMAALLILPVGLPYFAANREFEFARSLQDQERASAKPVTFFSVAQNNWLYRNVLPVDRNEPLFAGALIFALAFIGAVTRRQVVERTFWILLVLGAGVLALGPTLHLLGGTLALPLPFRLVYEYFPGFQGMRAPARFFILGMLGLSVLAAGGTKWVLAHVPIPPFIAVSAGIILLGLEYNVAPLQLVPFASGAQTPPVYRWLGQQPQGNVLELPMQVDSTPQIASAMVHSTYHWHTLPYGYGSFIPPTQTDFLLTVNTALENPSPRLPNVLREFNVRYVIVNDTLTGRAPADKIRAALAQLPMFESIYHDESAQVFRVNSEAPAHPLQFDCLAPAYAAPNSPYTAYLTVHHSRHYPIVNDDLGPHTLTLEWRMEGETILAQTDTIRLPYVLRERIEGVPMRVAAPSIPGAYDLFCLLDGAPQSLHTQSVRVAGDFQTSDTSPALELIGTNLVPETPQRGNEIIATFFWRRRVEELAPILMQVRVLDEGGSVRAELTRQPVIFTYPVRLWREGELVADGYALPIPADAPRGNYRITIRAINENIQEAIPFRDPRGQVTTEFAAHSFFIP